MEYQAPDLLSRETNDCLQLEFNWTSVAGGFTRILMSYAVYFVGGGFALSMIFFSGVFNLRPQQRAHLEQMWLFYGGSGLLSIIGLISFWMLISGKWQCLMSAPDRFGARSWMFLTILTMAMTFVLNWTANSYAFRAGNDAKMKKGAGKKNVDLVEVFKRNRGLSYSFMGARFCDVVGGFSFLMFLRACANCMGSRRHQWLIFAFLGLVGLLTAATVWSIFFLNYNAVFRPNEVQSWELRHRDIIFGIFIGWACVFFLYLFTLVAIRSLILSTMDRVRTPLVYESMRRGEFAESAN